MRKSDNVIHYSHEMLITIPTWTGAVLDGICLANSGSTMRVAVRNRADAVEFRFRGGQWFSEDGEPVEIHGYEEPNGSTAVSGFGAACRDEGCEETGAWLN